MNARGLCDAVSGALDARGAPREQAASAAPPNTDSASTRDPAATPVTADEALAIVRGWRDFGNAPPRCYRVAAALAGEVERLRSVGETCADLLTDRCTTLAAIRAALPEIIGCWRPCGPAQCNQQDFDTAPCCDLRRHFHRLGLIPAAARPAQEDDGA